MATSLLGPCSYTFSASWTTFSCMYGVYAGCGYFSNDPNMPTSVSSSIYPSPPVYPNYNSTRGTVTADGLYLNDFSIPRDGGPYYADFCGPTVGGGYGGFYVEPYNTTYPTNSGPRNNKPTRSYNPNANGLLPVGFYIKLHFMPARRKESTAFCNPMWRYNSSTIGTPDGRNLTTLYYYKGGNDSLWAYGGSNPLTTWNYLSVCWMWQVAVYNSYISSSSIGGVEPDSPYVSTRRLFETATCQPCV
jgi:hypothetical protein